MGNILNTFKKSLINNILTSVSANTTRYYAFAANPIPNDGDIPTLDTDDYNNLFISDWTLLFGKKISNTDIVPMTRKIEWTSNTVYDAYDNSANNLSNSEFFVVIPSGPGTYRHIYKCLNNANGLPSTVVPDLQQTTAFTKSDGYTWKYMYSISDAVYTKFEHSDYIPITSNSVVSSTAKYTNGVDRVDIINAGSGYNSYHSGIIKSVANSTVLQIENTASNDNDFYTNNAIYIYNTTSATAQLIVIENYIANLSGKWVHLETNANTNSITPSVTQYSISPRVVFDTNGDKPTSAYTTINPSSNSINSIVIIDNGYGITRASATIVSNSIFGTGANVKCVVGPPGGHGHDVISELGIEGMGISFSFNGTETENIPTNILYNRIGLLVDPYNADSPNNSKGSIYTDITFDQLLVANVSDSTVFTVTDTVVGQSSNAKGIVVFSNTTQICIAGDMYFQNNEIIISANTAEFTTININKYGDIYAKDLYPVYTQNITDVERIDNQQELFKIFIQL